jgi:phage terminase large subunit-like protein
VLHFTGRYPAWWVGRRFNKPVTAWIAGEDVKSMRDSMQPLLFGKPGELGTGMIPGDDLVGDPTSQRGTAEAIDTARVRHISGGTSRLTLKTYEQGREAFQAAKVDVGVCDEEPPMVIYTEFLTRLMSTVPGERNGTMMCAFTPLRGRSDVVRLYMSDDTVVLEPQSFGADLVPAHE